MFGSCSASVNCSVDAQTQIEPNRDIVGLGVLIAFVANGLLTFVVVVFAYFTDSVPGGPDTALQWSDNIFLRRLTWCRGCRSDGTIRRCHHTDPELNKKYRDGMSAIILALSDQQLVTGPAMMIAGLLQDCTLSCYEYMVLANLGWLSSVTHLSSLVLLRQYLRENPRIRDLRVLLILANLGLLLYVLVLSSWCDSQPLALPLPCIWKVPQKSSAKWMVLVNVFIVVLPYWDAFLQLYFTQESITNWILRQILYAISRKPPGMKKADFNDWYRVNVWNSPIRRGSEAWAADTIERGRKRSARAGWTKLYNSIQYGIVALTMSYWASLLAILYEAAYAVAQLITSRLSYQKFSESRNTIDFGQLVPLFLLALPILAAVEAYYDITAYKKRGHLIPVVAEFIETVNSDMSNAKEFNEPEKRGLAPQILNTPGRLRGPVEDHSNQEQPLLTYEAPNHPQPILRRIMTSPSRDPRSVETIQLHPIRQHTSSPPPANEAHIPVIRVSQSILHRQVFNAAFIKPPPALDEFFLYAIFIFSAAAAIALGATVFASIIVAVVVFFILMALIIDRIIANISFSWHALRRCRHIRETLVAKKQEQEPIHRPSTLEDHEEEAAVNEGRGSGPRTSSTTRPASRPEDQVDPVEINNTHATEQGGGQLLRRRTSLTAMESNIGFGREHETE